MTGGLSLFLLPGEPLSIADDFNLNSLNSFVEARILKLAFPDNDNGPPFRLQLTPHLLIPFLIPGNFRYPKISVRFRYRVELTAFVPMPKASVDEYDSAILGEDDVRFAWQPLVIYPIPEPLSPQGAT